MHILNLFRREDNEKRNEINPVYDFIPKSLLPRESVLKLCSKLCYGITLKYLSFLITHNQDHSSLPDCSISEIFTSENIEIQKIIKYYKIEEKIVDLSCDGVIALPWNKNRMTDFISNGFKCDFQWKYDNINHHVTSVKPFGIYFVTGGNHSICFGVIFSGGKIPCNNEIDFTEFLRKFSLTSQGFISETGKIISKSFFMEVNPEINTLFQLGKYLI